MKYKGRGHELIEKLNEIGGKHAVGQVTLVENRLVGMKSRGVYETPGGTILYEAHKALEQLCLERDLYHYKEQVAIKYGELVYYGQWFHPLREALQAFVDQANQVITGKVRIKLFKGRATAVSATSPTSLYDTKLASFAMKDYDVTAARGFIDLFGLPMKVRAMRRKERGRSSPRPRRACLLVIWPASCPSFTSTDLERSAHRGLSRRDGSGVDAEARAVRRRGAARGRTAAGDAGGSGREAVLLTEAVLPDAARAHRRAGRVSQRRRCLRHVRHAATSSSRRRAAWSWSAASTFIAAAWRSAVRPSAGATLADLDLDTPGPRLVLGLQSLANADNVGAIFRNAAAFGVHAVVLDGRIVRSVVSQGHAHVDGRDARRPVRDRGWRHVAAS